MKKKRKKRPLAKALLKTRVAARQQRVDARPAAPCVPVTAVAIGRVLDVARKAAQRRYGSNDAHDALDWVREQIFELTGLHSDGTLMEGLRLLTSLLLSSPEQFRVLAAVLQAPANRPGIRLGSLQVKAFGGAVVSRA